MIPGYQKGKPPYVELHRRIAAAQVGKTKCVADDLTRSLTLIEKKLQKAVDDVFEAFAEVLSNRAATELVSDLDVALAKCKACYKRLVPDEKTLKDMLEFRGDPTGTAEYTNNMKARQLMKRSVEGTRKTYRALRRDLLVNHATPFLGTRAQLVSASII